MTKLDTNPPTTANNQRLVAELRRFATFQELRQSQFYKARRSEIKRLLDEPRLYRSQNVRPRLRSFLRVVEWNIERGSRLAGIIGVLNSHPILRFADLLLINELDQGMRRSGNVNVALELGTALSAHSVFGVEYLELTKGVGDDLKAPGDNTAALHGNAILTRHAFSNPRVIRLPRCEKNFESQERRIGGRIGLLLDLEIGETKLVVGTTHLDVVNTPRCRARQMRAVLEAMEMPIDGGERQAGAAIVGGDLNTHTFARGTRFRAMNNATRILTSDPDSLRRRLLNPQTREPALREFARFGYGTQDYNDRRATSRTIVSNLDEPTRLPAPMKRWVRRRIGPEGLLLEFRLDWLAARGVKALKAREVIDEYTGVESVDAQTIQLLMPDGVPLSDHDPIVVDLSPK